MSFWKRTLLTMVAGALGGLAGVGICYGLMIGAFYFMPFAGVFLFFPLLGAMPFVGAFCAVQGSAIGDRFLDRFDPNTRQD